MSENELADIGNIAAIDHDALTNFVADEHVAHSGVSITAGAGLLMVSNFKYFSPKGIKLKEKIPFVSLVLIVMAFAIVALDPPRVLLFMCVVYSLSGPAVWVWKRFMRGS